MRGFPNILSSKFLRNLTNPEYLTRIQALVWKIFRFYSALSKMDSPLRRSLPEPANGIRSRDCTSPSGFIANKAVPTEGPDPASDVCGLDPNPGHVS